VLTSFIHKKKPSHIIGWFEQSQRFFLGDIFFSAAARNIGRTGQSISFSQARNISTSNSTGE